MAKNISLMGASYSDVPAVTLPQTGGGTARFDDASVTTATASDVAEGKVFLAADGTITTGTATGGGGAISVVDTPDGNGGTIRTITAVNISDTTATAEDVASGKYFYTAAGIKMLGTAAYLPSTYQRVEYLGATEQCYFALGAREYAGFGFDVVYRINERHSVYGPHIISDSTGYLWFVPRQHNNSTLIKWGGTETQLTGIIVPLSITNYASFNIDISNRIDLAGQTSQTVSKGSTSYGNVYLLCYGTNPTNKALQFSGYLYHVRFYNNGSIVEEFIPCYRKSDSVPGLYDIVNQIFYTNAGSGSFTVGRDVS